MIMQWESHKVIVFISAISCTATHCTMQQYSHQGIKKIHLNEIFRGQEQRNTGFLLVYDQ